MLQVSFFARCSLDQILPVQRERLRQERRKACGMEDAHAHAALGCYVCNGRRSFVVLHFQRE